MMPESPTINGVGLLLALPRKEDTVILVTASALSFISLKCSCGQGAFEP